MDSRCGSAVDAEAVEATVPRASVSLMSRFDYLGASAKLMLSS